MQARAAHHASTSCKHTRTHTCCTVALTYAHARVAHHAGTSALARVISASIPLRHAQAAVAMPKRKKPLPDLEDEECCIDADCSTKIVKAVAPRRTDRLAARMNLRGSVFRGMLKMLLPFTFFNILFKPTISPQLENTQWLDFIDMYMGEAAVRNGMRDAGMVSLGFDIRNDPWQDSDTDRSILMMFQMFRRLKDRGGSPWGTVCSTWVCAWHVRRRIGIWMHQWDWKAARPRKCCKLIAWFRSCAAFSYGCSAVEALGVWSSRHRR